MFEGMSKIYERLYIRPVLVLISSVVMSVALRIDFSKKAVLKFIIIGSHNNALKVRFLSSVSNLFEWNPW